MLSPSRDLGSDAKGAWPWAHQNPWTVVAAVTKLVVGQWVVPSILSTLGGGQEWHRVKSMNAFLSLLCPEHT